MRSDTRAEARALELRPRDGAHEELRRGESTLQALVVTDPIYDAVRWVLTELPTQFTRFGRTGRWKRLIEPIARVREVWLHHAGSTTGCGERFDAVTYGDDHQIQHVIDRVALGTKATVEDFLARAIALETKGAPGHLGGAILIAPRFEEDALAGYVEALRAASKRSMISGLDALGHKEGFVRLSSRSGFHVLLVEETDGERRPLVFE